MTVVVTLKLKQVKVIEIYVTNNFSQSNSFDVIKNKKRIDYDKMSYRTQSGIAATGVGTTKH